MLGLDSISHWIILLVLVLLVFGTGKLRNAGSDLGRALADFRKGLKDGEPDAAATARAEGAGKDQPNSP